MNQTESWGDPISYEETETLEGSQGMKQAVYTFSAEVSPARTFPLPVEEPDSKELAPASSTSSPASPSLFDPDSFSSRTYPVSSLATAVGTSEQSFGTLADLGYGVAWRILDSRYFGAPQRRRRVFILGTLADGDPRAAAGRAGEILAVGSRCERHPAAGTEARAIAPRASANGSRDGGWINSGAGWWDEDDGAAMTLSRRDWKESTTLVAAMAGRRREDDENLVIADTVRSHPRPGSNSSGALVSFDAEQSYNDPDELAYLTRKLRRAVSSESTGVRRLTPTECERLQALPDNWTAHGPDSRRYAALGDAVTASVSEWIGRRILAVE